MNRNFPASVPTRKGSGRELNESESQETKSIVNDLAPARRLRPGGGDRFVRRFAPSY
jgi:hypothetical protein